MDLLAQYGLFLAKTITVVAAIGFLIIVTFSASRRSRSVDKLEVKNLNEKYCSMKEILQSAVLSKKALRKALKADKAQRKAQRKDRHGAEDQQRRIYVMDFHGDIKATAVGSLREEITAVLAVAQSADEVLIRLENAGGLVHEHGLAASQLQRIRDRGVRLTVAVDKVAASGGYMMACVADQIIAAPFAVVGSIGVLAQLPNFHRFLDQHGIDFEQIKAGELKRTLTMFGVNTDEDRRHFREQMEDIHKLFKEFVTEHRPHLDMARVATGEHWYGKRALGLDLIDAIQTSDDYLLAASTDADIYELSYTVGKRLTEKLVSAVQKGAGGLLPASRTPALPSLSWRRAS